MPKRIPNQLRKTMLTALAGVTTPHPTSYFADLTQNLPESCRRSPTQIAFLLKQLQAEDNRIESVVVAKNGISHHGQHRTRKHWHAPELQVFPDDVKTEDISLPPNQILITLDDETMEHLQHRAKEVEVELALSELVVQLLQSVLRPE